MFLQTSNILDLADYSQEEFINKVLSSGLPDSVKFNDTLKSLISLTHSLIVEIKHQNEIIEEQKDDIHMLNNAVSNLKQLLDSRVSFLETEHNLSRTKLNLLDDKIEQLYSEL